MDEALVVFQDKKIRRIWHDEGWYFSVHNVGKGLLAVEIKFGDPLKLPLADEMSASRNMSPEPAYKLVNKDLEPAIAPTCRVGRVNRVIDGGLPLA